MRTSRSTRLLSALLSVVVVVAALLLTPVAPSSAAPDTGRVRGEILQVGPGPAPKVKVLWFASDWTYLGARRATGGYSLTLPTGRYFLQFVDQKPNYDVTKNRPTTVSVTIRSGSTTVKTVRMRRGAAIGGTVRTGGKPGSGARIVAANTDQQSFEVTADKQGSYALGGLPPGSYSVFTYDRRERFVGRSTYLRRVRGSAFTKVDIALKRRAGSLLVDLYAGDQRYPGTAYVTAVSRTTGQFWTAKSKKGTVTFAGLHPGRYELQVPGTGAWLGATVRPTATVRSGRTAFGSARLTKRGASVTGRVVDANRPGNPLAGASVRLLDASGGELARTTSTTSGGFVLTGQLLTQSGVSVVVGPGPYSSYLGTGVSYCKYASRRISGVALSTGRATDVGTLGLPHLSDAEQDGEQCRTPAPTRVPVSAGR
ncbi:carboxypeptidase regulatory-like domain-containing protein [Nocardioides sp. 1609]|uniref:carboxypeptidase regulatory-like domain-containing protein n=1 Tax=Nocardioides sp. 1609 TaxID=2508327 RepID=UPI0014313F62|nr:carboxypeptidase regulatory-like domain-containing protein [Nocardioides sp. 1609]